MSIPLLSFININKMTIALHTIDLNMQFPKKSIHASTRKIDNKAISTTSWAKSMKIIDQDIWFFSKPDMQYLNDVNNFEEISSDDLPVVLGEGL